MSSETPKKKAFSGFFKKALLRLSLATLGLSLLFGLSFLLSTSSKITVSAATLDLKTCKSTTTGAGRSAVTKYDCGATYGKCDPANSAGEIVCEDTTGNKVTYTAPATTSTPTPTTATAPTTLDPTDSKSGCTAGTPIPAVGKAAPTPTYNCTKEGYCTVPAGGNIECTKDGKKTVYKSAIPASTAPGGVDAIVNLVVALLQGAVLFLLWIIGYCTALILWLMLNAFIIMVQINPAEGSFLDIAREPWRLVANLGNAIILASFFYVGFLYILDSAKQKGQAINDFLTNVVIIAICINFTLAICATMVNVSQGVGNTFVGAYTAASGKTATEALAGNFIDSIENVSFIRCGKLPDGKPEDKKTTSSTGACTNPNMAKQFGLIAQSIGGNGDKKNIFQLAIGEYVGQSLALIMGEVIFILITGWGIWVMFQVLALALFRSIGLWLLMITSPLALIAYFSPFQNLKNLAGRWVEAFLTLLIFYPAFILTLIIVGRVSLTFSTAARDQITKSVATSDVSGALTVSAATGGGPIQKYAGVIILLALSAAVSIAAMQILTTVLTKEISKVAQAAGGAVWGATKLGARGLGSIAGGLGGLGGTGAGAATNWFNERRKTGDLSKANADFNKADTDLTNAINSRITGKRLDDLRNTRDNAARNQKEKRDKLAKERADAATRVQRWKKGGSAVGGSISYLPYVAEYMTKQPKKALDVMKKKSGAVDKSMLYDVQANAEIGARLLNSGLRSNKYGNHFANAIGLDPDADPDALFRGENDLNWEGAMRLKAEAETQSQKILYDGRNRKYSDNMPYDRAKEQFDKLMESANKKGGINKLSSDQQDRISELLEKGLDDKTGELLNSYFADASNVGLMKGFYDKISDKELKKKINAVRPDLNSRPDAAKEAGRDAAQDKDLRSGLNRSMFSDPDFVAGAMEALGNDSTKFKELFGFDPNSYFNPNAAAGAESRVKKSAEYKSMSESAGKAAINAGRDYVSENQGGIPGRDNIAAYKEAREFATTLHNGGEVTDKEYQKAADDIFTSIQKTQFNQKTVADIGNADIAAMARGDFGEAGKEIAKRGLDDAQAKIAMQIAMEGTNDEAAAKAGIAKTLEKVAKHEAALTARTSTIQQTEKSLGKITSLSIDDSDVNIMSDASGVQSYANSPGIIGDTIKELSQSLAGQELEKTHLRDYMDSFKVSYKDNGGGTQTLDFSGVDENKAKTLISSLNGKATAYHNATTQAEKTKIETEMTQTASRSGVTGLNKYVGALIGTRAQTERADSGNIKVAEMMASGGGNAAAAKQAIMAARSKATEQIGKVRGEVRGEIGKVSPEMAKAAAGRP